MTDGEINEMLRQELLLLAEEDRRMRETLAADGLLGEGYHPRMEAIHKRNAAHLRTIIERVGWPSSRVVAHDGAEAAWLIAQHAIGEPDFQRYCLQALHDAARSGGASLRHAAMLEDRIRMFEGRPQLFGTQLEPGENGMPRPYLIEDPEGVEDRRRAVGLEPLSERLAREPRMPLPKNRAEFDRKYQEWLVRVGWRK
jgi:hypothetical protein